MVYLFKHLIWSPLSKLFTPQVSIALTLVICLIVIWIIGLLFDRWFTRRKFLLAVIKTLVIGVSLVIIVLNSPPNNGSDKSGSSGKQPGKVEDPPKDEPPSIPVTTDGEILYPKERKGVEIVITFTGKDSDNNITVLCENQKFPVEVKGKNGKDICNDILQAMINNIQSEKDDKCFGVVTFENANNTGFVEYLEREINEYHLSRKNLTRIQFNERKTNQNGEQK